MSLFFELIQISLGVRNEFSSTPTGAEWQMLFAQAKRQTLVGVLFSGIERLPKEQRPPQQILLQWYALKERIVSLNKLLNKRCVEVQQRVLNDGFRSVIMKGQGNALLYPNPLLRTSGDIDLWLEGDRESIIDYVQGVAPTRKVNELEMPFNVFKDVVVEVHYHPFIMRNPLKNRLLQKFFLENADEQFKNRVLLPEAGEVCITTEYFNVIHQLAHIFHHLFTEGIGLRQVMDYFYLLNQNHLTDQQMEDLRKVIHQLALDNFASALMWILGNLFGLPKSKMLLAPNEKDGKFLLEEIMFTGNFGHHDVRVDWHSKSKFTGFLLTTKRNLTLLRFAPTDWFWGPTTRIYHYMWRILHGYV